MPQQCRSASEAYLVENHGIGARRQAVIFEEPPSGGFSRAIWLECANQQTFKGDESGEFPHEVGLFLSYPPEDVKGFIAHRANDFKCAGLWKVYGNEEKARSLFAKYKNARRSTAHSGKAARSWSSLPSRFDHIKSLERNLQT